MATLVLTVAGNVLGGPIGGAIGATIGQVIDREILFKPAAREGPRLTELALQTSSYGTPIPKLFGTIRVAGSVIWSTDLIESRSTEGRGKGRPGTTVYSYAASFAVLLSARAIEGVGRIWADGTLIRGAAGDWKTPTGFRLHLGDEDQPADPLIASAEGALAPAHRGCAYAVFENMPLGDYGNRIPSLTFEVVADTAPVGVGAIAAALADEVDDEAAATLDGFAATGASVAGVLETLAVVGGAWWRPGGTRLAITDGIAASATIADQGPLTRSVAGEAAGAVGVAHHDPARDYQRGVQRARRPGGNAREERIELPAALSATAAQGVAAALLARGEAARVRRTVRAPLEAMDVAPGAVVALAGSDDRWRVLEARLEAMQPTLVLEPVVTASVAAAPATSGRVLPAPDVAAGRTILHAAELPPLGDEALTAPRLTVMASGTEPGWRRAALLYSVDGGASWIAGGATAAPAITGVVEAAAPIGASTWLRDERSTLVVVLDRADMMLGDADAARLDGGANLALIGDELVQFARAEPLGGRRWRLGGLLRGRRGTEAAAGPAAGARFVLVERDAAATIDLPVATLGGQVRVLASGSGDAEPVEVIVPVGGRSVLPPAPVHLTARREGAVLTLGWVRRSRAGWRWIDGVDAPLAEEAEAYRVTVTGAGGEQVFETVAPALTLAAPDAPVSVTVRQRGTFGLSMGITMVVGEDG